jgi:putative CocE/NonD family hydrolase
MLAAPVHAGDALTKRLYLSSNGRANTATGDGVLSAEPATRGRSDRYTFDPKNPVPAASGSNRQEVEARNDVLVYSTAPLERSVQVNGLVTFELYAESDARDAGFTAALEDVEPDGKTVLLGSASSSPGRKTPGKIELTRIDLGAVAHAFQPGHRIRLEVSSGGNPAAVSDHRVLHDIAHPSALLLPVVE